MAQHKSENDIWVVIHGKVYDVTPFMNEHPGGADILLDAAGKDATGDFEDTGHSQDARKLLKKYEVGAVDESSKPAAPEGKKGVPGATTTVSADSGLNPGIVAAVIVAVLGALFILLNP